MTPITISIRNTPREFNRGACLQTLWPCAETRISSAVPLKQNPENKSFSGRQNTAVRTRRPA